MYLELLGYLATLRQMLEIEHKLLRIPTAGRLEKGEGFEPGTSEVQY